MGLSYVVFDNLVLDSPNGVSFYAGQGNDHIRLSRSHMVDRCTKYLANYDYIKSDYERWGKTDG